jgi:hypothetical protein
MQLKDFISQTLIEIVHGVKQAQATVSKHGGAINPSFWRMESTKSIIGYTGKPDSNEQPVFSVEFDVAISSEETSGSKGGFGIIVAVFGGGAQSEQQSTSSNQNRIKFVVPILLPEQDIQ